jgi:hypothetical protein
MVTKNIFYNNKIPGGIVFFLFLPNYNLGRSYNFFVSFPNSELLTPLAKIKELGDLTRKE